MLLPGALRCCRIPRSLQYLWDPLLPPSTTHHPHRPRTSQSLATVASPLHDVSRRLSGVYGCRYGGSWFCDGFCQPSTHRVSRCRALGPTVCDGFYQPRTCRKGRTAQYRDASTSKSSNFAARAATPDLQVAGDVKSSRS